MTGPGGYDGCDGPGGDDGRGKRRFRFSRGVAGVVFLLALAGWPGWHQEGRADSLVADLTDHLIAITTGFTGAKVTLFGSIDAPGDVAVVVTGPADDVLVRRKSKVAGLWLNRQSLRFHQVPGFYLLAANRPLDHVLSASVLERHNIGLANLPFYVSAAVEPAEYAEFRAALIRVRQEAGLYGQETLPVQFISERLFRVDVTFPANVPTGIYTVRAYLVQDGDVESAQTTPLSVSKAGFSAEVFEFSRRHALIYGLLAVIGAAASGWLAGFAFRKG